MCAGVVICANINLVPDVVCKNMPCRSVRKDKKKKKKNDLLQGRKTLRQVVDLKRHQRRRTGT